MKRLGPVLLLLIVIYQGLLLLHEDHDTSDATSRSLSRFKSQRTHNSVKDVNGRTDAWNISSLPWQQIQLNSTTVYAKLGYFDDRRRDTSNDSHVYVIVVATRTDHNRLLRERQLHCVLYTHARRHVYTVTARVWAFFHRELPVNGQVYTSFLLSCPVTHTTATTRITDVGFAQQPVALHDDTRIPVYQAKRRQRFTHEVGLCLAAAVMFGSFTAEAAPLFIEWFELHRMFGVTEFTLYNATAQLSADVQRVFDYYTKRGLLQLHQIQPPDFARHVKNRYAADLGMRLALNDCMYRNMYRYRYIVVVDLDEILVPLQHRSYQQLMAQRQQSIDEYGPAMRGHRQTYGCWIGGTKTAELPSNSAKNNWQHKTPAAANASTIVREAASVNSDVATVSFRSDSFFLTYPREANSSTLRTQSYFYANTNTKRRNKSILNPRLCIFLFSHNCQLALHQQCRLQRSDMARVFHYRPTCNSQMNPKKWSTEVCDKLNATKTKVTRMQRYKKQITERFVKVHNELFGPS